MTALATLIRRASATWEPLLEAAIFGTVDPDEIERALVGFVAERLGPVDDGVFYRPGVGVVAGLRLVDGLEVVAKVHHWNPSSDRLAAIQTVQAHLASVGLPAPRPLSAPAVLGNGMATIEELLPGATAPGHDPAVRRTLAEGLHDLILAAGRLPVPGDLPPPLLLRPPDAPLWWEPHDLRFDFPATAAGAEWIDELATQARRRLEHAAGTPVVGHFDWRVENLGFAGTRITAIYDWDSLAVAPEAVVVGNTAAAFTADWSSHDPDPLPSVAEMRAFVADYEDVRGKPFTTAERESLDAANLYLCAYGARCQHSDMSLRPEVGRIPKVSWLRLLRERGDDALAR